MKRTIIVIAGSLLWGAALAGGSATWSGGGQSMQIDWRDADTVRMNTSASDYMLVRGGKAYMVSNRGGQPMVLDWDAMRSMVGAAPVPKAQGPAGGDAFVSMEATGRTETVAGIEGEYYRITYREDGVEKSREVVLSDHPLAVEMTQAWFTTMQAIAGSAGGEGSIDFEFADRKLGMLRSGDDFHVTDLSDEAPPAADFELPAKPQSIPGM